MLLSPVFVISWRIINPLCHFSITGPVCVGVRPNIPVECVSLLLGNDLDRKKLGAKPIVTSELVVDVKSLEIDAELVFCIWLVLLLGR